MTKVAVIEDDQPTSDQLKAWILSARPGIVVDQWFTRDDAEAAIARNAYDLIVLDIELGRERHAGVAIINAINKGRQGTPVLVVSAMPATIYRSIMKALDAWDYLQKTTFEEADFIDTFLEILRATRDREAAKPGTSGDDELSLDPLRQNTPLWHGKRVNIPSYIVKPGDVVQLTDRARGSLRCKAALEAAESRGFPEWIAVDVKEGKGTFKAMPQRSELSPTLNEGLVIELYSK